MALVKYTRGKEVRLTKNFTTREFDCKGKTCRCIVTRLDTRLVRKLQMLRRRLGKPITINSGNRCAAHNREVGGSSSSYHLNTKGKAADIAVKGVSPAELARVAQELGFTGVGRYDGTQGRFVHVDVRPSPYFWLNTNGENRPITTHGGERMKNPYTLAARTLRIGSKGNDVRAVQWVLDAFGFECSVDGDFGSQTAQAVREFQSELLLTADGIVGEKTLAALREVSG